MGSIVRYSLIFISQREQSQLLLPLEKAMQGKVKLNRNGHFYLKTDSHGEMEMSLVAEGLRKIAMLAQLISTGALFEKGFLYWDEPEANINPLLLRVVAQVIVDLSRTGIQIFIATHSLFLLRELEILSHQNSFEAQYFALSSDLEDGVKILQGSSVHDIDPLTTLDEELRQSDRFRIENGNTQRGKSPLPFS